MNEYEALANAIIEQAAKDYRAAWERLVEEPSNQKARRALQGIEGFFASEWYRVLTTVDGDKILHMLREEADYDSKRIP